MAHTIFLIIIILLLLGLWIWVLDKYCPIPFKMWIIILSVLLAIYFIGNEAGLW